MPHDSGRGNLSLGCDGFPPGNGVEEDTGTSKE